MKENKRNNYIIKWSMVVLLAIICFCCGVSASLSHRVIAQTSKTNLPIITIDNENFDNPPNAVLNKEYRLFSATAVDAFGDVISVKTSLYMYYYSQNASSISIENNKFTPTMLGEYTVEYSATDIAGNVSIATYNFKCIEKAPLNGELSYVEGETLIGEITDLPTISFENNIGDVSCSLIAKIPALNKSFIIADVDKFIPEYVGEYKIIYSFNDYVESGEVEYLLTVKENDCTKLYGDVQIPKYFVLGCPYELPLPNFITYIAGKPVKVIPKVLVSYGSELPIEVDYKEFVPTKEGKVIITYSAIVNGNKTNKQYFATVVDAEYSKKANASKYFYSDYIISTPSRSDVMITTATSDEVIDFINPILAERTSMVFKIKNTENFFNSFDIYLTDSVNSDIKVKFSLLKYNAESSYFSINGGKGVKTTASFYDGKSIEFNYSNSTLSANIGEMSSVKVKSDISGNEFLGFPSGKVYLSFSFGEINKQSSVNILSINGQSISRASDQIAPQTIYYRNDVIKTVGDEITIDSVLVSDVLCPNYFVEYYVLDPDNNYVVDLNGLVLSPNNTDYSKTYSFKLQKYGSYNVVIKVKDGFNNEELYSYGITVADIEGPTIYFDGYISGDKKVGETVTVPKGFAKDNLSEECSMIIYYMDGTGVVNKLEGNTLKLKYSGRYTIYYYAIDEVGNVSSREITFNVVR